MKTVYIRDSSAAVAGTRADVAHVPLAVAAAPGDIAAWAAEVSGEVDPAPALASTVLEDTADAWAWIAGQGYQRLPSGDL